MNEASDAALQVGVWGRQSHARLGPERRIAGRSEGMEPDGWSGGCSRGFHSDRSRPAETRSWPDVLLTAVADDDQLLEAIRLGAQAIVLKDMAPQVLLDAIREVYAGGQWLENGLGGRALRRLLTREQRASEAARLLTAREREIVCLLASGLRNRAIADRLSISEGT